MPIGPHRVVGDTVDLDADSSVFPPVLRLDSLSLILARCVVLAGKVLRGWQLEVQRHTCICGGPGLRVECWPGAKRH